MSDTLVYRIHLHHQGTFESSAIDTNLHLESVPRPKPGNGQVLIRIRAAALNYRDLLVLTDDERYDCRTIDGLTPLADGAGEIEDTQSSKWKVGDRVVLAPNASWKQGGSQEDYDATRALGAADVHGTLRQYAVMDEDAVLPCPAHLGWEQAAAVPAAFATSWNALFGGPKMLRPGEWVLTQGTGGVSLAALQLATVAGAKVIATSSSDGKLDVLRQLGAKHTINYSTTPNWGARAKELTAGRGVHQVVDVGGASTIVQSLQAVKKDGLVSTVGFLGKSATYDIIPDIVFNAKIVRGLLLASVPMMQDLMTFVDEHQIKPITGRAFGFREAKEAYLALTKQDFVGKIVIKVD